MEYDKGLLLNKNRRKIISVVMKDNKNLEIKKTLDHFIQREEWYNTHGIPYKKVFLFYGPAGTGKSSMIKAISNELQRHIHYLNLSLVTNDNELNNLMANINFKEKILVIEDIDSQVPVVCKRFKTVESEPTYYKCNSDPSGVIAYGNLMNTIERYNEGERGNRSQLTLSNILNQIDGQYNNYGMILVITTNYPENLEESLIRDRRIDEKILFDYCDFLQIINMFNNFYDTDTTIINTIKNTILKIYLKIYNVAPCNVEHSMQKYYSDPLKAIEDLILSTKDKNKF